jgi:MFS transporter, DHA3 family, macrolide efflux protein
MMNEQLKYKKGTYHLYTFLVSKMIGTLGSHVYAFGISLYILSLTGSSLSFATNILLSYLPRTIISPIAGLFGDRIPRKWLVLGGQAGVILSVSTLLLYTHTVELSLIAIYITTVFNSIFSSFSSISFSASIANLVDEGRLQKAMSFNQLSQSISGIGGPVVGGMLYGFVSMEVFLAAFIIAAVITLTLESTMNFTLYKKETSTNASEKETMLQSLKAGFLYVGKQNILRAILWMALWINLFLTSINIGGSFILVTILELDSKLIGFVESGAAIGMLGTSIYFASRSNVKHPLVFIKRSLLVMSSLLLFAAVPLFFNFSTISNFSYYFMIMLLFGVLGVLINTPIGVMMQLSVDEEYRGRVFGIVEMMSMAMIPFATIFYGFLYDVLPAEWILIVSGATLIICVLFLLRPSIIEMAHPELKKEQPSEVIEAKA